MYYSHCKRYKRKKRIKKSVILITVALLVLLGYFYYSIRILGQLIEIAKAAALSDTTNAVNYSVLEVLQDNLAYSDLITVEKNDEGDITLITANSYRINVINREISLKSQEKLTEIMSDEIDVPMGSFTGLSLLAGYGPKIKTHLLRADNVVCNFSSTFESVGINQTRHCLYINVTTNLTILVPGKAEGLQLTTEVLICEGIIIGKIPDVYLKGSI